MWRRLAGRTASAAGADMTALMPTPRQGCQRPCGKKGLIDYRHCLAEDLAETGEEFDIVYSSEVINM